MLFIERGVASTAESSLGVARAAGLGVVMASSLLIRG
jgi:hypothetical protein